MHVKLKDADGNYIKNANGQDIILMNVVKPNANLEKFWKPVYGAESYEEVFVKPNAEDYLKMVRDRRNMLLTKSDWTQLTDSPLSSAKKAEWAAYRQQLRDMPDTVDLVAINWPVDPNGNR